MSTGCSNDVDSSPDAPKAIRGTLNLSAWDLSQDGPLTLDGGWAFDWMQLLEPDQNAVPPRWFTVLPGSWQPAQPDKHSSTGYGTYRLRIILASPQQQLALRVPQIATAYKLWIGSELVASKGQVGTDAASSRPQTEAEMIYFQSPSTKFTLTLQVSNYEYRTSGVQSSIILGTAEMMAKEDRSRWMTDAFLYGSLFVMSIYHLGVFRIWRKDLARLYFGLFCLALGVYAILISDISPFGWVADLPWKAMMRAQYVMLSVNLSLAVLLFSALYPVEYSRRVLKIIVWSSILLSAYSLLAPFPLVTYADLLQIVITIPAAAYGLYVLGLAAKRKLDGAFTGLIGVLIIIALYIYLVSDGLRISESRILMAVGFILFVWLTSLIIHFRFAKTYREAESMSRHMREVNTGLERKINERTADLELSNQSLEKMNAELARLENSRRRLLSNISHDLGTPMTLIQGYVEAMLDGVVDKPEQLRKYLRLIHARIIGLNRLIHDLFELSKLEARQISFAMQELPVREYVGLFFERYELEVKNAGLSFELRLPSKEPGPSLFVMIDVDRLDQVYTNIIYNAIKHTPAGGTITLEYTVGAGRIVTRIGDSGPGIKEEDLPYVFDRFYRNDKLRSSAGGGSGLGLSIAKEIVEFHAGTIWAESSPGQGASILFVLPVFRPKDGG
ncbi:sensor histidine kinase [Paenibacillus thalictri]|uniref:sensor histidine kinase n=1 Tax=Paenibacillus thalictri TaxID=2527873 RepID=UPI0013EEFF55|nr:ATP-binding protein [Paenibacillus thalictri]